MKNKRDFASFLKCYHLTFFMNNRFLWAMGGEAKENI